MKRKKWYPIKRSKCVHALSDMVLGRRETLIEYVEKGVVKVSCHNSPYSPGGVRYTGPVTSKNKPGKGVRYRVIVRMNPDAYKAIQTLQGE